MVTLDRDFVDAVYETVQLPDERVHEEILNVPPALLSLSATIPDGIDGELDVSVTDIESVTEPPALNVLELDVNEVLVECNVFDVEELFVVELVVVELVLVWLSA